MLDNIFHYPFYSEVEPSSSGPTSPSIDACLTMAACGGISMLSVSEQDSAGESERVNISIEIISHIFTDSLSPPSTHLKKRKEMKCVHHFQMAMLKLLKLNINTCNNLLEDFVR